MTSRESLSAAAPAPLNTSPKLELPQSVAMRPAGSNVSSNGTAGPAGTSAAPNDGNGDGAELDITSPHELTNWVEDVLTRLETNFDNMSSQVLSKLEAISKRIDSVEQGLGELLQDASAETVGMSSNPNARLGVSTPAKTADNAKR